ELRSRMGQFHALARDRWIIMNSEIEPEKLHALGVITFRWNLCEQKLLTLFGSVLNCPVEETHVLTHDLSGPALIARARTHKSSSLSGSPRHRPPLCNRSKCRDGATRDIDQPEWRWSPDILVYPPILHDDLEVLGGVGDQVDILQWIAVDQQQIGKRALFHDAELAGIGIAFAGQCQQFGVGSGCHCERFGGTVPADERGQNCPLLLRQRLGE